MRYRPGHFAGRSGEAFPGVSAGRQFDYTKERRHRSGIGDLEAHRRDARRQDMGGLRCGAGIHVFTHAAAESRAAGASASTRAFIRAAIIARAYGYTSIVTSASPCAWPPEASAPTCGAMVKRPVALAVNVISVVTPGTSFFSMS